MLFCFPFSMVLQLMGKVGGWGILVKLKDAWLRHISTYAAPVTL